VSAGGFARNDAARRQSARSARPPRTASSHSRPHPFQTRASCCRRCPCRR